MKFLRISAIFLFCAALLVVGSLYYINSSPEYVGTYRLDIESGMSAKQIGDQLAKEKLIRSSFFFRILAQFKKFDRRINAGSHWISGLEDTDKILDALLSGGLDTRKITIPEGLSLPEVAELLQHELSFTVTEFMKVAADPQIVHRYGPQEAISMEGYLFPDTYSFHARSRPRDVIALMSARHNELITADMQARADSLGMNMPEIITLASIIEKEAATSEERPVISQVFHKRLTIGYKLGADPTVKYALRLKPERLSLRDIEIDSPYNTYRYAGLPPGPICNPGILSIRAALYPASTDYLYFVANWDDTHTFTRTLREHSKAKQVSRRLYRRMRANRNE